MPRNGAARYHDLAAFKELRRRNGLDDGPIRTNTKEDYFRVFGPQWRPLNPIELPIKPPVQEDPMDMS